MKTVCIALPKDLRDAGMPDAHLCALAYKKAREVGAEEIRVHDPSGRSRVFTLQDVETYLRRFPAYLPLLNVYLPQPGDSFITRYRNTTMRLTRGLYTPA